MIDNSIEFLGINIAILTVSDTRNFDNDKSGSTLIKLIEDYGHTCLLREMRHEKICPGTFRPRDIVKLPTKR